MIIVTLTLKRQENQTEAEDDSDDTAAEDFDSTDGSLTVVITDGFPGDDDDN